MCYCVTREGGLGPLCPLLGVHCVEDCGGRGRGGEGGGEREGGEGGRGRGEERGMEGGKERERREYKYY